MALKHFKGIARIPEFKCNSISKIINTVSKNFEHEGSTWYRGHIDVDYKLIPSAFRQGDKKKYDEYSALTQFKIRFPNFENDHSSMFDWLTLLQHYGLPTRLLDWTENLFYAIFFACYSSHEQKKKDGAIFILDANSMTKNGALFEPNNVLIELVAELSNVPKIEQFDKLACVKKFINEHNIKSNFTNEPYEFKSKDEESWLESLSSVYPVVPKQLNERLKRQQSVFTLHGGKYTEGIVTLPIGEITLTRARLIKIIIPYKSKSIMLKNLKLFGIDETIIFPDYQNQADFIKQAYFKDI